MRFFRLYEMDTNIKLWKRWQEEKNCPECGHEHIQWQRNAIYTHHNVKHKEDSKFIDKYIYRARCPKCKTQWQTPELENYVGDQD